MELAWSLPRRPARVGAALLSLSLVVIASAAADGSCDAGGDCGVGPAAALAFAAAAGPPARAADCDFREAPCLERLNISAGADLVRTEEVMAKLEEVGRDGLHKGGVSGSAWVDRFAGARCESTATMDFPESPRALEDLRARLREVEAGGLKPVLVHADSMEDGIGARFKKAVELVSAALHVGFYAVALAVPPAGGLLHPEWEHGAVHCHESPAMSLAPPAGEMYPLRCWRFELQADFLAQSPLPEGRMLLWGAPMPESALPPAGGGAAEGSPPLRLGCFRLREELPDGVAWNLHGQLEPPRREVLAKLFASARAFAAPALAVPGRREALCGHGGPKELRHLALHVRRGDVGDDSGYAPTQRMRGQRFGEWLCSLAEALGTEKAGERLAVHVHTEAKGQSRGDLRRLGLPGFEFPEGPQDNVEPIFHTLGRLKPAPPCGSVLEEVHVAVNDNPRDALLCMARADILVTSHSSLGWAAAVLNEGLVLHPDGPDAASAALTHWDLRDQYLDWAENWFLTSAVQRRPEALAAAFRRSRSQR